MSRPLRVLVALVAAGVAVWTYVRPGADVPPSPAEVASAEGCPARFAGFPEVLGRHFDLYPAMDVQDVYKLAHQALAGPGHAAPSLEQATAWLDREIAGLGSYAPGEPAIVPVRPDGRLVRVNLRPYVAGGGAAADLARDFVAAAEATQVEGADLAEDFSGVLACLLASNLPLDDEALAEFFAGRLAEGLPAVHHSETYNSAYRPAYRVVLADAPSVATLRLPEP